MGLPVRGALTVVRPATDADVDWLVRWHGEPEVSRYWGDSTCSRAEIEERLGRPRVDSWIVEADGEPVGYVQSWWEEDEPLRGGLDMFLIPVARGRGLGPDAARALARSLLDAGWAHVTVDPYAWNERALRGWRNAGFVELSRHPAGGDYDAEWVLMRFQPVSDANST
jgi:aminoglycoside 6'-N-acetyltransferase